MIEIQPTCGNAKQCKEPILIPEKKADLEYILNDITTTEITGIDTETSGVNPKSESPVGRGRVICWSLATEQARYFLWAKDLDYFKIWLQSERHKKVGHNVFAFDRHMFNNHGIKLNGVIGDTMRMARFWRSDKRFKTGLKSLMEKLFGYKIGDYKDLFSCPSFTGKINTREELGKSTRKVGEVKVPTILGTESWIVSWVKRELIPLDEIRTHYPERLATLYDYATLDAKATREIYFELVKRLERRPVESL